MYPKIHDHLQKTLAHISGNYYTVLDTFEQPAKIYELIQKSDTTNG